MKETIKNIIALIVVGILIIQFPKTILSTIGIIILIVSFFWIQDLKHKKKIKQFMKQNNGKYFLSYSSNKKLKPTIETELKPLFNFDYAIIYNNRNKIECSLRKEELAFLQNESFMHKLPILYKIQDDKVQHVSLFKEVYDRREQRTIKEVFEKNINEKLKKIRS